MRAIHHSPRLDKPRREEKQTFPPRWIHVAVGQDKCAYILKEPRTCYRDGRKRRSVTGDPERKREAIRMDGMNEQRWTHAYAILCDIYMWCIHTRGEEANGVIYIAMVSVASSPQSPPKAVDLSTKSINSISFLSSRSRKCPCPRHHHTERHSPDVQLRLENHARTEFLFRAVELAAIDVLLRPSV